MVSAAFQTEMDRKLDSHPVIKVEHISKTSVTTDISSYFLSGANLQSVKERAPDEIQAGSFDVVLANHDDKFSEYVATSLFYNTDYHGSKIRLSLGFVLPDGTTEYSTQGIGFIDQLLTDGVNSQVTLRCRDLMWRLMDQLLHVRPADEIPAFNSVNVGNGIISVISTKPFTTTTQDWTLACTLGGADGVATFSVTGSVSGAQGTATSGTEFTANNGMIKFEISGGATNWALNDEITFSTNQYPQWDAVNLGEIIWSILTGYNWGTDTQETWSGLVFDFDSTQSDANTDLDYNEFVTAIDNIDTIGLFDLTGYIPYNTQANEFLQNLLVLVVGSLYVGNDGRIKFSTYIPQFGAITTEFTDAKKITSLSYNRSIDEVLNSVAVEYLATETWPWSNASLVLDGIFIKKNATSITNYKELGVDFQIPWYTSNGLHVQDFADKLVTRYGDPPLNIKFMTGMDALETEIGDRVLLTDTKMGVTEMPGEVSLVGRSLGQSPRAIQIGLRRDSNTDQQFGFIGSEANEGDGLSPQSDDYDTATDDDKAFAYFGSAATTEPDYRMF